MPEPVAPATLGVQIHQPEAQLGVAFTDGRPPVILHRHDLLERTRASLGVYSRRDAQTFVALKRRAARFGPVICKGLYRPPDRRWFAMQLDAVRAAYKGLINLRTLGNGSARALIDQLFETSEIRILLYHLAIETGLTIEERGSDVAFLGYSLWIVGRWRIVAGGMGAYSNALGEAARGAGVELLCSTPATRILFDGGQAVGVETTAGRFEATQGVVAAVPILTLFDKLLDANDLSAAEKAEIEMLRQQRLTRISTSFYCLEQAPNYKSAQHDPEINRCLKTVIGYRSPADVVAMEYDLSRGLLPRPGGVVRVHSLWDSSLSPPGRHAAAVDSRFPSSDSLDAAEWSAVEAAYPAAFLESWASACDGGLSALGTMGDFGASFERRMLIRMGESQFRASADRLYFAGPGMYPGGGIHGACGLNAAQVILADVRQRGGGRTPATPFPT